MRTPSFPVLFVRPRRLLATALTTVLLAGPLATTLPTAATAAPARPAASTSYPVLRYDDRGAAVKRLQRMLGVQPASGWFGPLTLAAVKRFEKRQGLKVNGIVGAPTWRAIVRASAASGASRSVRDGRACPAPGARFTDTYGAARGGGGHAGVDMLAPRGTPIRAVESGTVLRAHWSGSSGGWTITLQGRSGSKFFYAHNDVNLAKSGEKVTVGEVIAKVGSTGNAGSTNHLHFEYWKSGKESAPVNPTPLVRSLCS
ncbi:MAG TPA: peptidoglycan DD-metalloendopeptidase family protein [Candidatus Limnocylindria bacterium]|nr:peptidoglycan DD-metalloendopeptidase family protein [Candidatus Limnocylindria bacterium]